MKPFDPTFFPHRLKQVREIRRWTQADLAKKTGLKPAAIGHFEQGTRSPSLKNLCRLCNVLQVQAGDLLT